MQTVEFTIQGAFNYTSARAAVQPDVQECTGRELVFTFATGLDKYGSKDGN